MLSRVPVPPGSPLAFQGTADDARALLIGITATMVTVIALLLGLAVVALQLSSTQFSPRLLRNYLRDRPNQIVLSVFVGTFAYSTGGLFEVGVSGGERSDEFPRFAVTVAVALLFVSLALLVYFADHLAHSIQVDHIMRVVERSTLPVIRALPTNVENCTASELPPVPPSAIPVAARASGYVQIVHLEQLLAAAAARRVNVRVQPRIGEHVVAGTPLAWIWPAAAGTPGSAGATRSARAWPPRCGSASNAPSSRTPAWGCASSSTPHARRCPRRSTTPTRRSRPSNACPCCSPRSPPARSARSSPTTPRPGSPSSCRRGRSPSTSPSASA